MRRLCCRSLSIGLLACATFSLAQAPSSTPRVGLQLGDDNAPRAAISEDGKWLVTGGTSGAATARLYDIASGRLIRSFVGHTATISRVAINKKGTEFASSSDDKTLRIWEVHTGKLLRTIDEPDYFSLNFLSWSPDGKYITAGTWANKPNPTVFTVHVWDSLSGKEVAHFQGEEEETPTRFSPDSQFLFFGTADPDGGRASVAKASIPAFKIVKSYPLPNQATDIFPAPDNKHVLVATLTKTIEFNQASGAATPMASRESKHLFPVGNVYWTEGSDKQVEFTSWPSGKVIGRFNRPDEFFGAEVSPTGKVVALRSSSSVTCYDVATGKLLCNTKALTTPTFQFANSGVNELGLESYAGTASFWDLQLGRPTLTLKGSARSLEVLASTPTGNIIVTGGEDCPVAIWDKATGKKLKEFPTEGEICAAIDLSPDGRWLAFSSLSRVLSSAKGVTAIHIYDLKEGKQVKTIPSKEVDVIRFSDDSSRLFYTEEYRYTHFVKTDDWSEYAKYGSEDRMMNVATLAQGLAWVSMADGTLLRYRLSDGGTLPEVKLAKSNLGGIAVSPDKKSYVAYALYDKLASYDIATNTLTKTFEEPPAAIRPLVYSSDGRFVIGALDDGTERVWSVTTGKIVATFVSFVDGSWAAIDPAGRFDASNGGDIEGMFWIIGDTPIQLSQFKHYFYEPHLLARIMGGDTEKLMDVPNVQITGLYPDVSLALDSTKNQVNVKLTDQGGGIGKTDVFLNGVNIASYAPPKTGKKQHSIAIDIKNPAITSRLLPTPAGGSTGVNQLDVVAYNRGGSIRSRMGVGVSLNGHLQAPPSNLYALVVGSNYQGTDRALRYAVSDAEAFAHGLALTSSELLGKERVHISVVDGIGGPTATKAHILAAMSTIAAKAQPADVIVIYFSGHGVARSSGKGGYFYLTSDSGNADPANDSFAGQFTLSSAELERWLQTQVKAAKRAIILDTCAAGAAVADLTKSTTLPSDFDYAWQQLKDNSGLYVLAGCAGDKVSYEATNVQHGLLTYALLEAIDQAKPSALTNRGFLDVDQWFTYTEGRVRELMDNLGLTGLQKPDLEHQAKARDYPVGLVDDKVAGKLDLPLPGPVLILDTFRTATNDDPIDLANAIDKQLQVQAPTRGTVSASYWPDVKKHPKALQLRGSYSVTGDVVVVSVRLMRFVRPDLKPETFDIFEVKGSAAKAAELAKAVIDATQDRIPQDWGRLTGGSAQ